MIRDILLILKVRRKQPLHHARLRRLAVRSAESEQAVRVARVAGAAAKGEADALGFAGGGEAGEDCVEAGGAEFCGVGGAFVDGGGWGVRVEVEGVPVGCEGVGCGGVAGAVEGYAGFEALFAYVALWVEMGE